MYSDAFFKKSFAGIVVLFLVFFASTTFAMMPLEEAITDFSSWITVNADNSIDVVESITYETGTVERHGLQRDIYPNSSQDRKMDITVTGVTNEEGDSYQYTTFTEGKNLRIRIGDPNVTYTGERTYIISYHATRATGQLDALDEIYWNVTGNGWEIPIYYAEALVSLPQNISPTQSACYVGAKGSTSSCEREQDEDGEEIFYTSRALMPGEGLTIAVGFPKGVVAPYTGRDAPPTTFEKYLPWIVAGLLPVITLMLSLLYWFKVGRDAKGTGIIVPQYDVIDNLTPMEVAGILNEKITSKDLSAQLIYLATLGYIKIQETEEKAFGMFTVTERALIKLRGSEGLEDDFTKRLFEALFETGIEKYATMSPFINRLINRRIGTLLANLPPNVIPQKESKQSVTLSDLTHVFYREAQKIIVMATTALLTKGYYKNLGRMKNAKGVRIFAILFGAIWGAGFVGGIIGATFFDGNVLPPMLGVFLSVVLFSIVSHFNPAKTKKGALAREHILGLKEYLQIAEKDRLEFHNAPGKNPEVFEKLLPYAMALGVADVWAKEFEDIYLAPPSWYSGSATGAFHASTFVSSLSSFSSDAASSLTSSPSSGGSGGSGGGGSSGGGGGGGGGGGW